MAFKFKHLNKINCSSRKTRNMTDLTCLTDITDSPDKNKNSVLHSFRGMVLDDGKMFLFSQNRVR